MGEARDGALARAHIDLTIAKRHCERLRRLRLEHWAHLAAYSLRSDRERRQALVEVGYSRFHGRPLYTAGVALLI